MTKVQSAVLPLFLSNKDVCVKACTGSGKTLAFIVPIVERLLKIVKIFGAEYPEEAHLPMNRVVAIIIAPSRELVIQIYNVLCEFKHLFQGKENGGEEAQGEEGDKAGDGESKSVKNPTKSNQQQQFADFTYFIGGDKLEFDLQRI